MKLWANPIIFRVLKIALKSFFSPPQSEEEVKAQKRQLAQSASPPKIETQEPSQLRQRPVPKVTTPTDTETTPPQEPPTDRTLFTPIIRNTVAPPQRETGQNSLILIWLIIFALIVLIARRVYLHLASPEWLFCLSDHLYTSIIIMHNYVLSHCI